MLARTVSVRGRRWNDKSVFIWGRSPVSDCSVTGFSESIHWLIWNLPEQSEGNHYSISLYGLDLYYDVFYFSRHKESLSVKVLIHGLSRRRN